MTTNTNQKPTIEEINGVCIPELNRIEAKRAIQDLEFAHWFQSRKPTEGRLSVQFQELFGVK